VLIIGHQGILRIIYAFYMGLSRNESPYISIPLNHVIELNPGPFHCDVKVLPSPPSPVPSQHNAALQTLRPHRASPQ
jgi:broad specificity phosphatase PhoE